MVKCAPIFNMIHARNRMYFSHYLFLVPLIAIDILPFLKRFLQRHQSKMDILLLIHSFYLFPLYPILCNSPDIFTGLNRLKSFFYKLSNLWENLYMKSVNWLGKSAIRQIVPWIYIRWLCMPVKWVVCCCRIYTNHTFTKMLRVQNILCVFKFRNNIFF